MRYVIMANGKGTRWAEYGGIPKHLITVQGETLLDRTSRLVHASDPEAEVIISSADERCEAKGATRYVPVRNELEIDRFVPELTADGVVFLYGDTYYKEALISQIVEAPVRDLLFFGDEKTIFAIKVGKGDVMSRHFQRVRDSFLAGKLTTCKGWQVYQSYLQLEHNMPDVADHVIGPEYVLVHDGTGDFNTPDDFEAFKAK